MNSKRRLTDTAFTLVEILICLAVVGAVSFPFLAMLHQMNRSYATAIRYNDLRSERDRVGYRIVSLLRHGQDIVLSDDNRSVSWGVGQKVAWDGKGLELVAGPKRYALASEVAHFSVFRRDETTRVTVELKDPQSGKTARKTFSVEENHLEKRL